MGSCLSRTTAPSLRCSPSPQMTIASQLRHCKYRTSRCVQISLRLLHNIDCQVGVACRVVERPDGCWLSRDRLAGRRLPPHYPCPRTSRIHLRSFVSDSRHCSQPKCQSVHCSIRFLFPRRLGSVGPRLGRHDPIVHAPPKAYRPSPQTALLHRSPSNVQRPAAHEATRPTYGRAEELRHHLRARHRSSRRRPRPLP